MAEAVRGACAAARNDLLTALGHLETAFSNGCHEAFCLRWLLVTLISSEHYDAAVEVLDHWKEREGETSEIANFEAVIQQRKAAQQAVVEAVLDESEEDETISVDELVADASNDRFWRVDASTTVSDVCTPSWPNHAKSIDTIDFAAER